MEFLREEFRENDVFCPVLTEDNALEAFGSGNLEMMLRIVPSMLLLVSLKTMSLTLSYNNFF